MDKTVARPDHESGAASQEPYWCFISYRHSDNRDIDREWATWLQQQIESYEVPAEFVGEQNSRGEVIPEKIYPVFRDEESLPADAELGKQIEQALERSRLLVVICSPSAVESRYVNQEIEYFILRGRRDRILTVIISGEPGDNNRECFPEALRHRNDADGRKNLNDGPLAADFRLPNGQQGYTSAEAYRLVLTKDANTPAKQARSIADAYEDRLQLMKLKIIAGILGRPLDEVRDRDKAHQLKLARKRNRQLSGVVAVVLIILCVAVWQYVLAERARASTERQQAVSELRRIMAESDTLRDSAPILSAALAVEAHNFSEARNVTSEPVRELLYDSLSKIGGYSLNRLCADQFPVAIDDEGKFLAGVSQSGRITIWSLDKGFFPDRPVQSWDPHSGQVAAFSFAGQSLVSIGRDQQICRQPIGGNKPLYIDGVPSGMTAVYAFSDSRWIVAAGNGAGVIGWHVVNDGSPKDAGFNLLNGDLLTVYSSDEFTVVVSANSTNNVDVICLQPDGQVCHSMTLVGHTDSLWSAEISSDQAWLSTVATDGTCRLWSLESLAVRSAPVQITEPEIVVSDDSDETDLMLSAFDAESRIWVTADEAGHVRGYELRGSGNLTTRRLFEDGLDEKPSAIAITSTQIVAGTESGNIRMWPVTELNQSIGNSSRTYFVYPGQIDAFARIDEEDSIVIAGAQGVRKWSVDEQSMVDLYGENNVRECRVRGDWMVTDSWTDGARLWNLSNSPTYRTKTQIGSGSDFWEASSSPDGRFACLGMDQGGYELWKTSPPELVRRFDADNDEEHGGLRPSAFSDDGEWLAMGGASGRLILYHLQREDASVEQLHSGTIRHILFAPDSESVFTGGEDGQVIQKHLLDQNPAAEVLWDHDAQVLALDLNATNTHLASGSADGSLVLLDPKKQFHEELIPSGNGIVRSAAFNEAGTLLAAFSSADGRVRVFELNGDSARELISLSPHPETFFVWSLVFDSSGNLFGGGGNVIDVWRTSDRSWSHRSFRGHLGQVFNLMLIDNDRTLVSGGEDGNLLFWDLNSQYPSKTVRKVEGHGGEIRRLASVDARTIISAKSINISSESLLAELYDAVGRNLTDHEWQQYFPDREYEPTFPPARKRQE